MSEVVISLSLCPDSYPIPHPTLLDFKTWRNSSRYG
jgi:hypothetical protein